MFLEYVPTFFYTILMHFYLAMEKFNRKFITTVDGVSIYYNFHFVVIGYSGSVVKVLVS